MYIDIKQVAALANLHTRTIRRMWQDGLFLKPKRFGRRSIRWDEAEVRQFLASRPAVTPERKVSK